MKIVFNIIAMLTVILAAYFGIQNSHLMIDFSIRGVEGVNAETVRVNMLYIIYGVFLLGMFGGAAWLASYYFSAQNTLKEYKRKLEKTSVQSSSDSSRVEVLEAKITVLEKALKSALEQKND